MAPGATNGAPLTIDELVQLYWRRDATLFHVHNQALTPEEIFTLLQGIAEFLHITAVEVGLKELQITAPK